MKNQSEPDWKYDTNLDDSGNSESIWMISYLDTFTLLLAFFVLITIITGKQMNLTEAEKRELTSSLKGEDHVRYPLQELLLDLNLLLESEKEAGRVIITADENELRLQFPGSSFFLSGEANVLPNGKAILEKIVGVTHRLKHYPFKIDVEGHADNRPINSSVYPSNWELSAARAANIVKSFIESGYDPKRLKASGYGDTFPLKPNEDILGNPIPENLDLNRRVVIRLYF